VNLRSAYFTTATTTYATIYTPGKGILIAAFISTSLSAANTQNAQVQLSMSNSPTWGIASDSQQSSQVLAFLTLSNFQTGTSEANTVNENIWIPFPEPIPVGRQIYLHGAAAAATLYVAATLYFKD
jgi:hypothetical protein